MHLLKIYDILPIRRIVFALFVAFAFSLFSSCNQKADSLNKARGEMLDKIEVQMFQQPESLDSILNEVDTTNITPFEQARIQTIRALNHFNKEEYAKSIKELEQSETFFLKEGDNYHSNINKLIKAFTFEYLNLDNNAAELYIQCEDYFNRNHLDKFKFYSSLGLLRMSELLHLNKKTIFDQLKNTAIQYNDPNYHGLLFATMGVLEKNDSLKSIYYGQAKADNKTVHRWSRVYAIELNLLFLKIRKDHSKDTQSYYDNFNNKAYIYTPTTQQRMRYKYAQAYLYAKEGKIQESIAVANQVLNEAVELNMAKVESDCDELLVFLYKRVSDFKNAHRMLERSNGMREKNMETLQQYRLLALGAHYRYSELERDKLELKIQVQRAFLIIGAISLILIVMFSIGWFLLKESKYKHEILKLKNMEIEDQISNLLGSLKNKKNRNENLITQVEELKVQHNDSLQISKFLEDIDQKKITTWMEYEACFLGLRPGWIEKLKAQEPELTATDLKYCMCIYFNLNNFTIANLCNTGPDAVKSAKQRIRDKFSLSDAKEIYIFLKSVD